MIHSIDIAVVLWVCASHHFHLFWNEEAWTQTHSGKIESKRKQFRYGYYCIIIIDVQCCCCSFIVANMMHTLRYALHTLEPNIRGAEAWWCNQFFCICCIAWYSVCIFFFTLQQNHYLGIVRNNSNNKKFIYYKWMLNDY